DNNDLVLVCITPTHDQVSQFRGRFSRSASHIKNRTLIGMRMARRNDNDLQWQFTSLASLSIFEDFIDSATQLFFDPFDMAWVQSHTREDRSGSRGIGRSECRPEGGGRSQHEQERDESLHKTKLTGRANASTNEKPGS